MTIWAILPAAGIGRRMGSITPKQYLSLHGEPVILHSLRRLAGIEAVSKILIVLNPDDQHWAELDHGCGDRVQLVTGGAERFQSVLYALDSLQQVADAEDWVLVHDAVRPCVRTADILKLISTLSQHAVGGLLGSPVNDTLKRVNARGEVEATLDRSDRWRAFTPQMFRYGLLHDALRKVVTDAVQVTDEAAAIERLGHRPQMVSGHNDNIKITHESDLQLAGKILELQEAS